MTKPLPPSSSQVLGAKGSEPRKRLSLAVAQLDTLIARLCHLSELPSHSCSHGAQPTPSLPVTGGVPEPDEEH